MSQPVKLSEILHASELTEDGFQSIQWNGGIERTGVDFDFCVAEAEDESPAS